jgi:hypothetical protein
MIDRLTVDQWMGRPWSALVGWLIRATMEQLPMTEAEWLACTDPYAMLQFLQNKATQRQLRLFAVAALRRLARTQRPGFVYPMKAARCERVAERLEPQDTLRTIALDTDAVSLAALPDAMDAARNCAWFATQTIWKQRGTDSERSPQCDLLRCVVGNPFRRPVLDPAWLKWSNSTVHKIAHAIAAERTFENLPILADALEEAGCTDAAILDHCRSCGEHVHGCWLVDLILGKE